MAGRSGRHARSKWEWGSPPARSAEVQAAAAVDPDPAKRAPAPKDTRSWCRGKPGRAHVPVIVVAQSTYKSGQCRWGSRWDGEAVRWHCYHSEVCSECGKILRSIWQLRARECPDYPGSEAQRAEAEAEARQRDERAREWRSRRRRVITGPQGYRRKRQQAS